MNAQVARGYDSLLGQVATPREIEARLFFRLNSRLARARRDPDANSKELVEALHENERLWTLLAVDLASDENSLPAELRASLLSLSGFVINHSAQIRRGDASVDALLDVNLSMMRGLGGEGGS
ncbi:flagellar biosynthesis regulator FlaF [Paracoccus albus]|uniref:flagellar biosynthesis regulator FlaF n=1 Tax=Paracoccus albus TaxID=3017784 RepID=UPI0022F08EFC|nr:flagellar biosynthesis regulator FlaF [Paracoccus albus]WBU60438.1 flagellar biosynthesis regulator FlaF [Paracoccus albus]